MPVRETQPIAPLAIASLALSCLGGLSSALLVIPGIIFGIIAKKQISDEKYSGYSLAQAGLVVGSVVGGLAFAKAMIAMSWFSLVERSVVESSQLWVFSGVIVVVIGLMVASFFATPSNDGEANDEDK